jgi:hypothetical protein
VLTSNLSSQPPSTVGLQLTGAKPVSGPDRRRDNGHDLRSLHHQAIDRATAGGNGAKQVRAVLLFGKRPLDRINLTTNAPDAFKSLLLSLTVWVMKAA